MSYRLNQPGKCEVRSFILKHHKDADKMLDMADGRFERIMAQWFALVEDKATAIKAVNFSAKRAYVILDASESADGVAKTLQLNFKDHFR